MELERVSPADRIAVPLLRVFESASGAWEWAWAAEAAAWGVLRGWVVVPALRTAVSICLMMSLAVLVEKVSMALVTVCGKLFGRRPAQIYKCDPLVADEETGSGAFPMVLVQIPMYNEREARALAHWFQAKLQPCANFSHISPKIFLICTPLSFVFALWLPANRIENYGNILVYQLSIGAACNLLWPEDRIIIQVLDDSTDPAIKELVRKECEVWAKKGKNIRYETRANRNGYKAGALKVGMTHGYVSTCEFIAMFDADFQPAPDFLHRTVPFLVHNPKIALVQSRWKFVNASECLMTRTQEMSMDFHFKVEQESGSTACAFFGYNGTAGVWRIKAIEDAGGWEDRTTVEDMDLAVRARLAGWKFVYLGDVKVNSELPSTFKAYRYQQHRWSCGPANLFRKLFWSVLTSKEVSIRMKIYVIYSFFIARRILSHFVTFLFYCVVIPTSVFFPEVDVPDWGVIYVPTTITLINSIGTPSSFHLVIFWVLFENVMSLHRCKAVLIGLFEAGSSVNEWVVTEKLGDMLKPKPNSLPTTKKFKFKIKDRFNLLEISIGIYLMVCAYYDLKFGNDSFYIYIFPQSIAFITLGLGYVGTILPADK